MFSVEGTECVFCCRYSICFLLKGGVIALFQTEELKVQKLIARHRCI